MDTLLSNQPAFTRSFLPMLIFIRKNQKTLVLIVSFFVVIAFIWLYNSVNFDRLGEANMGRIYGRELTTTDFQRETRMFNLAVDMGPLPVAQALVAGAATEADMAHRYVVNVLVLRHEAAALGIYPDIESIRREIKSLPVFLTDGRFDPIKFTQFSQLYLLPRGFTEAQLEEVMRDNLRFEQLSALATAPVTASPALLLEQFGFRNTKVAPSVLRFDLAPLLEETAVADEEVEAYFEANQEQFQTTERRRVRYALFALDEEEAALEGRERIAALQRKADAAARLATGILDPDADFIALAADQGATIEETEWFSIMAPPEPISLGRAALAAALTLSEEDPFSDAFPIGDDFVVMQLTGVEPVRPLTFEEAREEASEQLRREKAAAALADQAAEIREQLAAGLEQEMAWEEVTAGLALEPEPIPAFSRSEPFLASADSSIIMRTSLVMEEKTLSDYLPTQDGGLLIYLAERLPIAPDAFASEQPFLQSMVTTAYQRALFDEWLRVARQASGFTRNPAR